MTTLRVEEQLQALDERDWDALYAVIFVTLSRAGFMPRASLSRDVLPEIVRRLPKPLQEMTFAWGAKDVVVADNLARHLRERLQETGSLEAFLQTAKEQ